MFRTLAAALLLIVNSTATAHFPWIYVTDDSEPRLFFGESLSEQDYHLPESIEAAEVWQDAIDAPAKLLTMEPLEEEGFTGLEADQSIEPRGVVRTSVVYGSYHGSKLTYYAQHFPADEPQSWPDYQAESGASLTLQVADNELLATVLWNGEPLAGARASLSSDSEEAEGVNAATDETGVARFALDAVQEGLNGVMVMHVDKEDSGEVKGEAYTSATHILTATFNYDPEAATDAAALPPVPEAISSFGAAVSDGWLYVYSGHIGQAHDHSRDNLSQHFRRLRLDGGGDWEELPMGTPLQGLPLVAHGGKLYRVGGLHAHNASGEEEDLQSVDEFAEYDPAADEWTDLTPLPGPRSSHNAVVLGDKVYVVGGWALSGDDNGDWQAGALAYDFNAPDNGWQALAEPPFKRRALAVGHVDGLIVVLCGMTDDADLSKQVFFYDPAEESWSEGPEFPGRAFHGFGLSAWNLDGKLYAGGMEGTLYQLDEGRTGWTKVDEFATSRFFHQLVPDGQGGLLAVGGASPRVGHTGSIERLDLVLPEPPEETEPPVEEAKAETPQEPKAAAKPSTTSSAACPADQWPMFRGIGTSVTAASDLPLQWSDEEGVSWRNDLPGYGQSSPIVWGDRVFITTMQGAEKETPTVLCYDLATGEELWRQEYTASQQATASNYVSRSAPTPCVDERAVYAWFESGDLCALTHEGEPLWERSLVQQYGKIEGNHGIGGSPLLSADKLIVPMLHGGPSYLIAMDPSSSETIWKTDFAARVAWSSPSLANEKIVLTGAGVVDAYDPQTGQQIWSLEEFDGNNVPSASVAGEMIVIGSQQKSSNVALQLTAGDATPAVSWRSKSATSSFASPLVYRGYAYFVSKAGVAHCVSCQDGQLTWKERLPESCWASPIAAGDRIYFFGKNGGTSIFAASGEPSLLTENKLTVTDDSRVYGVAAVSGRFLVRTGQSLSCIASN